VIASIPSGNTFQLLFNADGSQMFTSGENGLLRWGIRVIKNEGQYEILLDEHDPLSILAGNTKTFDFNEPKQLIAAKVRSGYVTIVDLKTNETREIGPHTSATRPMFSPDGQYVTTLTWHGLGIKVWSTESGEFVKDIAPDTSSAASDWSLNNNSFVVVSGDARTEWLMDDWSQISHQRRLKPDGWPGDASYSPDGQLLATTYSRYLPQLVDVETGNTIAVLEAPSRFPVDGLDWSDDGRYLSVAGHEKIQIWDILQIRKRLRDLDIDWQTPVNGIN
jgi:WD40 repeat protein